MDGGGRLVGSVGVAGSLLLTDSTAWPRLPGFTSRRSRTEAPRSGRRYREPGFATRALTRYWPSVAFAALVLGSAGLYGARTGGEYDAFAARYGTPLDIMGRLVGFEIDTITISGVDQLNRQEVLEASGVTERNSLIFLNAAAVRDRLKAVPLVRDVSVRKLFPNSLFFDITERKAAAIWQKNGKLSVVAADGVAIDEVHDARFNALPFIVGPAANDHLQEFTDLVETAGELRDRIRAGIYVGERRWTLQMDSGVLLMLPEVNPKAALADFAVIERADKLLDKDVITLDLRIPGRITARLSEDAAAARAAMLAKRPKKVMKE
jgi:cell division protein FtsQ